MNRIYRPLVPLLTITGQSIDPAWRTALQHVDIPEGVGRRQQEQRERVFRGEKPDCIPFSADLNWWFAERYHDGTLERDLEGVDLGKLFGGPIGPAPSPPAPEPLPGVEEEITWQGEPVRYVQGGYPGHVHVHRVHTPAGTLTAREEYASRCFGIREYPVKTTDDLKIVRYLYEKMGEHFCVPTDFSTVEVPLTPIQSLLVHLAGVETTAYLLCDAPAEIEALMQIMEKVQLPVVRELAKARGLLFSCENLSSDISAAYFDRYLGPQLARRSEIAHEHGRLFGIHMDGMLQPLLGRLHSVGVGLVNGLTAAPSGDVEPESIRSLAGPDIILWDILPQVIFTPAFSDQAFEAYVRRVIECYRNDARVILGIGDMLPVDGSIRRVERVVELLEDACGVLTG